MFAVMEWIRGGSVPGATFQIGQSKFLLPPEVMNRSDVQASGLALVARSEGFKDIPPAVQRAEDGAFIITRPVDAFELLVEHLLDLNPLRHVPLHEFASKYIALKSELAFWQLPVDEVPFHDRIYYETAWTDEHCLFPLSRMDAASFKKEESEEPQNPKRVRLTQVDEQPEEISKSYLDVTGDEGEGGGNDAKQSWTFFLFDPASAGAVVKDPRKKSSISATSGRLVLAVGPEKFFCKIPFLSEPCVHYGKLSALDRDFPPSILLVSPMESTIIWNRGCFIHIRIKEQRLAGPGTLRFGAPAGGSATMGGTGGNQMMSVMNEEGATSSSHLLLSAEINVLEREPSWLCLHPFLDCVLSGVKGPVPHIHCFDMPEASAVRFFPWGCLVVNQEVSLESRKKLPQENSQDPDSLLLHASASSSSSSPVALATRVFPPRDKPTSQDNDSTRRLFTFLQPSQKAGAAESGALSRISPLYQPAKPVVMASVLRSVKKAFRPIEKIYLINVDLEHEGTVVLRHGENFDVLDVRNQEGTDFEAIVSVNGGLAA
ncbi:hypothetical protein CSUI_003790, partial [Cystoisospora suis]